MVKYSIIVALIFPFMMTGWFSEEKKEVPSVGSEWDQNTPVAEVLWALGEEKPKHYVKNMSEEKIKQGEELVKIGKTTGPKGRKTKFISKYYACTSCHNIGREDPDLTKVDPEARLDYASMKNIPYLQGSTFWGIVDRETWYNDDYVKKYGDLLKDAKTDLKESIQVCAVYCSQGRRVKKWEIDAILAYYWSLQMKMGDLEMSKEDWATIKENATNTSKQDELKSLVKSKYMQKSPATFSEPPKDKKKGYAYEGRPEKGEIVYRLSCMHCHRANGESDVILDKTKSSFRWLKRHMADNTQLSTYYVARKGTYDALGHQEYMPHYTLEKLSDQQMEDLRSYIEMGAGEGFSALPSSDAEDSKRSLRF